MNNPVGSNVGLDVPGLLDEIADVVYALDEDGRFIYVNVAGQEVFGWSADQLLGRHFSKVIADESKVVTDEQFRRGLEDAASRPFFETTIVRPDGMTRELEIHAGALYRDGVQVGRQGVGRDITAVRNLQAELAEKSTRLSMLEDRQRAAMDLYRQFSLIATKMADGPEATSGTVDRISGALAATMVGALGLDDQDLVIIRLVAEGYSNQEIAEHVHLSVHTVKDRVGRIITKLDARSRAGVALRASDAGLLP